MSNSATDWLDQQCRSIDSIRAGAMLLNSGPEGSQSARVINWPSNSDVNPHLVKLAQSAMSTNEPQWKVLERPGDQQSVSTAVAYPLCDRGQVQGAVTIEYTGDDEVERQNAINSLQAATPRLLARLVDPPDTSDVVGIAGVSDTASRLIRNQASLISLVVEVLEPASAQAAYTGLVNDLSQRFDCRRVSFGEVEGKHVRMKTISNSAEFDERSAAVGCIARAMQEAASLKQTVVFPQAAGNDELSAHKTLLMEQDDVVIVTLPLVSDGGINGVLLMERSSKSPFSEAEVELLEQCARMIGPILGARQQAERPARKRILGGFRKLLVASLGSRFLVTKILSALILATVSFLLTYTDMHRVTADAAVEPIDKFVVTSPFDSYVAHAYKKVGDVVTAGEVLADLDRRDLLLERTKWEGELAKLTKEYRAALARRDRTEVRILKNRQEQVHTQLSLLETLMERSKLVAPIDGVIILGDLDEAGGAPVSRGQLLFEVARLDSYRVEMKVDERDIASVHEGQEGQLLLTSMPDRPVTFFVDTIVPVSQGADGINAFMVYADLPYGSTYVRPGMEGIAKIHIGQQNLMWIYTHKLTDWIRLQWWRLGW